MTSNLQELLVTSGVTRSGNTFVNYSFSKLFNLKTVNPNKHTLASIRDRDHTFVPFRDPLECVSSWRLYQEEFVDGGANSLEADLRYYLRFHTGLTDLLDKVTLLDFDLFKDNLSYLSNKVTDLYDVAPSSTTIEEVKTFMNESNRSKNLPRNTEEQKQVIQAQITAADLYQDCLRVYTQLKAITAP
jgi:hypothetical protein